MFTGSLGNHILLVFIIIWRSHFELILLVVMTAQPRETSIEEMDRLEREECALAPDMELDEEEEVSPAVDHEGDVVMLECHEDHADVPFAMLCLSVLLNKVLVFRD